MELPWPYFYIHDLYCLWQLCVQVAAVFQVNKKKENLVNLSGLTGIIVSKE